MADIDKYLSFFVLHYMTHLSYTASVSSLVTIVSDLVLKDNKPKDHKNYLTISNLREDIHISFSCVWNKIMISVSGVSVHWVHNGWEFEVLSFHYDINLNRLHDWHCLNETKRAWTGFFSVRIALLRKALLILWSREALPEPRDGKFGVIHVFILSRNKWKAKSLSQRLLCEGS